MHTFGCCSFQALDRFTGLVTAFLSTEELVQASRAPLAWVCSLAKCKIPMRVRHGHCSISWAASDEDYS